MAPLSPGQNKAIVLEAFHTLFNLKDVESAKRYWSPHYVQHSAHVPPGRDGLFGVIKAAPELRYEHQLAVAEGDYVMLADQVEGWTHVVEAVHGEGGRIFMQLWHGGRVGAKGLLDGHEPVSPSGVNDDQDALEVWGLLANGHYVKIKATPSRALSAAEVEAVVEEYRVGAANAKAAGFDGVEIHSANGYLPHQFLSSATNQRTDRYGGSVENRVRFLQEVVEAAISAFAPERVGVRLSPYAPYNHAMDDDPASTYAQAATMLDARAVGYVHLADTVAFATGQPALPQILADVKPHYTGSVIVNGGLSPEDAATLVANGSADAVAFGRLYIANPDLPARIKAGADMNAFDYATAYGGDARGYIDYPRLSGR